MEKRISGPGVDPLRWEYSYALPTYSSETQCQTKGCVTTSWTEVRQPNGSTINYVHSTRDGETEGQLRSRTVEASTGATLNKTVYTYAGAGDGNWPAEIGRAFVRGGTNLRKLTALTPLKSEVLTRDGVTYRRSNTDFDVFGRPMTAIKSSSPGYSKEVVTSYNNDANDWVLGQVRTVTVNGIQASRTDYNTKAQPTHIYAFGELRQSLTYHSNGNLWTSTDGNDNVTWFDSWKRGIPGTITYQDGFTTEAVINVQRWHRCGRERTYIRCPRAHEPHEECSRYSQSPDN